MVKRATIDATKQYRYTLERYWGADPANVVNFILLNPSTADATKDDPIVRACIAFAQNLGFDGLVMTNLFAYRATDPLHMKSCQLPLGPENDSYIIQNAKKAKQVIVAWGTHGSHCGRDEEVLKILSGIKKPYCLGVTKSGSPRHPLYVKRTVAPSYFHS